ncbi:MAG TPA: DUF5684 domain-containing protein [Thermoleophilia bacterium]|nr:DUF5684 domain-containing protein [Thermoleophilia bacterium]HQJ26791.1 DUF5684 domain-containing protein [Thermoleophilia bacterium]
MEYEYNYDVGGGLFAGVMIVMWLIGIVFAVLTIVGLWKTFRKAGLPGWAAIVPFYNEYNVVKMSNRPLWFFWAMLAGSLLAWIPFLGWLLVLGIFVLWVFIALDVAANFGQGTGFAILLIIFPMIMFLVLGFGPAQFNRIAAPESAGFGAPPMPAGGSYTAAPPAPPTQAYAAPPAPPATPPQAPAQAAAPAAPVTPPAAAPTAPVTPSTAAPTTPVTPPVTPPAGDETQVTQSAPEAGSSTPEAPPPAPPAPPAGSPPPPPPPPLT